MIIELIDVKGVGNELCISITTFQKYISNQTNYKYASAIVKNNYSGLTVLLITSDVLALNCIGLRTSKRIALKNGGLDCRFLKSELYEGSRKIKKVQRINNPED